MDVILQQLDIRNMVVDWLDFYKDSIEGGWKEKTTLNRIETAVGDYYGSFYKNEVMKRILRLKNE